MSLLAEQKKEALRLAAWARPPGCRRSGLRPTRRHPSKQDQLLTSRTFAWQPLFAYWWKLTS